MKKPLLICLLLTCSLSILAQDSTRTKRGFLSGWAERQRALERKRLENERLKNDAINRLRDEERAARETGGPVAQNPRSPALHLQRAGNKISIGAFGMLAGTAISALTLVSKNPNPTTVYIGSGVAALGTVLIVAGGGNLIRAGEDLQLELKRRPVNKTP